MNLATIYGRNDNGQGLSDFKDINTAKAFQRVAEKLMGINQGENGIYKNKLNFVNLNPTDKKHLTGQQDTILFVDRKGKLCFASHLTFENNLWNSWNLDKRKNSIF